MSEELKIIDKIRLQGFRPQVVGCFVCKNKVLLLYHKKYNLWQLPQGGINNQETVRQALKREMQEELGKTFTDNCDFSKIIITEEAQLKFPKKIQGTRELKTDNGQEIKMRGKRYLFIKIKANITELDINQTEFNDHRWLPINEAISLTNKIYQIGKKQITLKALKSLELK